MNSGGVIYFNSELCVSDVNLRFNFINVNFIECDVIIDGFLILIGKMCKFVSKFIGYVLYVFIRNVNVKNCFIKKILRYKCGSLCFMFKSGDVIFEEFCWFISWVDMMGVVFVIVIGGKVDVKILWFSFINGGGFVEV